MAQARGQTAQLDGFTVEYLLAPHMVVFSHGFGVRRDSNGMFTDLVDSLPRGVGYALFDYCDYPAANVVRITDRDEQVRRLRQVIAWARAQDAEVLDLVGHSRGSIIVARARLDDVRRVMLLAPPLVAGTRLRERWTKRQGTVHHGEEWVVPRSDGSTSIVPDRIFDEFAFATAEQDILSYADMQPLQLVVAGADEVLPDQDYGRLAAHPQIRLVTITGANHNFEGAARQELSRVMRSNLSH